MDIGIDENIGKALSSWELIEEGNPPEEEYLLGEITEGVDFLADFWNKHYLEEYIAGRGSKVKFVTGRRGSGKTHFIRTMSFFAGQKDYKCVSFSANQVWLHDFKEIYLEVFRQCDIESCLRDCADVIVRRMGYDPKDIGRGMTFVDYLSSIGEADGITKRELRLQLKEMFLDNPVMDNNFAYACSLICGGFLGHPMLETQNKEILLAWLSCDKSVRLLQLRALGLSPTRINKFNARHMLRSLVEVAVQGGCRGVFITIDDLEVLLNRSSLAPVHYTKMRREDTYESIRQLIDEIDSMHNVMFVLSFDRELMDNDNYGLKSYQALWMRIQNEIVAEKFNRFSDMVDLDELGKTIYTEEVLLSMAGKLSSIASENGVEARLPELEDIRAIMEKNKLLNILLFYILLHLLMSFP